MTVQDNEPIRFEFLNGLQRKFDDNLIKIQKSIKIKKLKI